MNSVDKAYLLQLIHRNGNLHGLALLGYRYVELIEAIGETLKEKLVILDADRYKVTSAGEAFIRKFSDQKRPFIFPDYSSRIPKLKADEIFVPKRNELNLEP